MSLTLDRRAESLPFVNKSTLPRVPLFRLFVPRVRRGILSTTLHPHLRSSPVLSSRSFPLSPPTRIISRYPSPFSFLPIASSSFLLQLNHKHPPSPLLSDAKLVSLSSYPSPSL